MTLPPHAQTNETGDVALRNHPLMSSMIPIGGLASKRQYVATTQAGICMVWIQPADVPEVLAKRGGCCGSERQIFDYANEDAVRIWTNRGGS